MSENCIDLDVFLHVDVNRKEFFDYIKTLTNSTTIQNLLTLYLILRCFKTQNRTDPLRLKHIFDTTYKTCILKHEHEIENILGADQSGKLSDSLKTGVYNEAFLEQVIAKIKKVLEREYVKYELKQDRCVKSRAASSSLSSAASSALVNKSGSTLSLNQIPNPYHVKTKAVKATKNCETQSLFEARRSKKSADCSLRKVKKSEHKNLRSNINDLTFEMEKMSTNSTNMDHQLDAHLDHVSRVKSSKSRSNQSVCQVTKEDKKNGVDVQLRRTVAYYMPGESLAYLTNFSGPRLDLAHFKNLITKRGDFRYFFKTKTDLLGEDCVVFQEITDDKQLLPTFNDKVIAKIEFK